MKLTLNIPSEIEASEVIIEGRKFLLVDADAFGGMYGLAPERPPKCAPNRRPKASTKPDAPSRPKETASDGTVASQIIELLKKAPRTSAELIDLTKRTPSAIYSALTIMRREGTIKSVEDDDKGRVNTLVNPLAA
jgi:hypothetical protein